MERENINEALRVIKGMRRLIAQTKIDISHAIEYRYAVEVVAEALEKHIPLKPKLIHKIDRSGLHYNDVVCECGCSFHYIGRVNYCPMCGQAIDWSEVD